MKAALAVLAVLLAAAGAGVGGIYIHSAAEAAGERAGYEIGYEAGHDNGLEKGRAGGYASGREEGYALGYDAGLEEGHETGQEVGYDLGYSAGNLAGYEDGYGRGKDDGYQAGVIDGAGHGYSLRDPTLQEVQDFLSRDGTDGNEYDLSTYVCSHYARDVLNAAEADGIRAAFVELRYSNAGHTIVAFDTIDEGMAFFEPQTDDRAYPVIGARYHETVEPEPGHSYTTPVQDDTILDILVIW